MSTAKRFSLFLALCGLAACTSDGRGTLPDADFFVQQGQGFLLRVGDTAGVATTTAIVLVRFNGVLEDSRCPETVECVQAGRALIVLTVQTTLSVQEVELSVPPGGGAEQEVEEVTIQVLELRPPAQEDRVIELLEYAVALRVLSTGELPLPGS